MLSQGPDLLDTAGQVRWTLQLLAQGQALASAGGDSMGVPGAGRKGCIQLGREDFPGEAMYHLSLSMGPESSPAGRSNV